MKFDFVTIMILILFIYITIGRTIGAFILNGSGSVQCHLSRTNPGKFVNIMMFLWPFIFFRFNTKKEIFIKLIKILIISCLLFISSYFLFIFINKYIYSWLTYIIIFLFQNIISFTLFYYIKIPGTYPEYNINP